MRRGCCGATGWGQRAGEAPSCPEQVPRRLKTRSANHGLELGRCRWKVRKKPSYEVVRVIYKTGVDWLTAQWRSTQTDMKAGIMLMFCDFLIFLSSPAS